VETHETIAWSDMSDWVVVYRSITRHSDNTRAPTSTSKEAALIHARALIRQGHEMIEVEGPNGQVIGKEEIVRWVRAHPE
jgi:hypothetical protein